MEGMDATKCSISSKRHTYHLFITPAVFCLACMYTIPITPPKTPVNSHPQSFHYQLFHQSLPCFSKHKHQKLKICRRCHPFSQSPLITPAPAPPPRRSNTSATSFTASKYPSAVRWKPSLSHSPCSREEDLISSHRSFQLCMACLKGVRRVGMCVEGSEARGLAKVAAQRCV